MQFQSTAVVNASSGLQYLSLSFMIEPCFEQMYRPPRPKRSGRIRNEAMPRIETWTETERNRNKTRSISPKSRRSSRRRRNRKRVHDQKWSFYEARARLVWCILRKTGVSMCDFDLGECLMASELVAIADAQRSYRVLMCQLARH